MFYLCYFGYILFIIMIFIWYKHNKSMRKKFSTEFRRVGKEKSLLQNQINQKPQFQSSDN